MRLRAWGLSGVLLVMSAGAALAAPIAVSPLPAQSDVQLVHRGKSGGWHCNRERWSRSLGWHYHSRRCRAWLPRDRYWQGKRWRKGCWINRRGTLVCRF